MTEHNDESIWQRLSETLFKARPLQDERIFTAQVMARVRGLEETAGSWRIFSRWAVPALALSLGGFVLALRMAPEPQPITSEAVLMGEEDAIVTVDWLASVPESEEMSDEVAHS